MAWSSQSKPCFAILKNFYEEVFTKLEPIHRNWFPHYRNAATLQMKYCGCLTIHNSPMLQFKLAKWMKSHTFCWKLGEKCREMGFFFYSNWNLARTPVFYTFTLTKGRRVFVSQKWVLTARLVRKHQPPASPNTGGQLFGPVGHRQFCGGVVGWSINTPPYPTTAWSPCTLQRLLTTAT